MSRATGGLPSDTAAGSRVEQEYDEAVESVHRAFCFPDHEQVGEWDRSMADALRRRGYAIVNLNAADCPTPPPAVDGTRCAECGGVKDDAFHVPCLVGGPFHYVKTCHPFTPPTPAPDTRLRALEAVREAAAMFLAAEDDWRVLDIHDDDEDRILASDHLSETRRALRALLAPDGEGSRS